SDEFSLLAVQGKNSLNTIQKLTEINLSEIKYYTFAEGKIAGVDALISRTGYTGEKLGFEILCSSNRNTSEKLWNSLFDAGKEFNIKPIGLGARDTLRLEAAYCLYGNDIDSSTNTIEAGLGWITKPAKGEFNGKSKIVSELRNGVSRKLAGFIVEGKPVARQGHEIFKDGNKIGFVTSGSFSPALGKNIGLGYIDKDFSAEGSILEIKIRDSFIKAQVVKTPFISQDSQQEPAKGKTKVSETV
ncbi:MAG: aminomethyltransferase family protein, partial [Ignavibacteria bacterium]